MTSKQALATTHTIAFIAGFAAAKAWDYDELSTYRDAHETKVGKVKRWAGNISIGLVGVWAIAVAFRASDSSKSSRV